MPQIRRRRYDWVLHLNDQWLGAVASMVSGAALRFDYETQKRDCWLWGEIFPQRIVPTADGHMVEQNMRVLQAPDVPLDPEDMRYTIAVSPADEALSQQKLAASGVSGSFVLIHPASRWFFKCWEDDRFAEVIAVLAASGRQVVLTSAPDPREVDLVNGLLQRVGNQKVVSLAGQLTLPALAATIAGASLIVGVDSVPMHIGGRPRRAHRRPVCSIACAYLAPVQRACRSYPRSGLGAAHRTERFRYLDVSRYLSNIPAQPVLDTIWRQFERFPDRV
jgi:heptosyltransferase-3